MRSSLVKSSHYDNVNSFHTNIDYSVVPAINVTCYVAFVFDNALIFSSEGLNKCLISI